MSFKPRISKQLDQVGDGGSGGSGAVFGSITGTPSAQANLQDGTIQGTFTPTNSAVVTSDSFKTGFQKVQGQIAAIISDYVQKVTGTVRFNFGASNNLDITTDNGFYQKALLSLANTQAFIAFNLVGGVAQRFVRVNATGATISVNTGTIQLINTNTEIIQTTNDVDITALNNVILRSLLGVKVRSTSGFFANLKTTNITVSDLDFEFPPIGGTLALTSDIPATVTASNGLIKTGNNIALGGALVADTYIDGNFEIGIGATTPLSAFTLQADDNITVNVLGSNLSSTTMTGNDITSYSQNNTTGDITQIVSNIGYGRINYTGANNHHSSLKVDDGGVKIISSISASPYAVILKTSNINANNITIEFPTTSGTLALTSNIPSLPTVATTVTSASTLTYTGLLEQTQRGDSSGGAFTTTLPSAIGKTGYKIIVKKISTDLNIWTIACFGAETIDGTATLLLSTAIRPSYTLQSDGANWIII